MLGENGTGKSTFIRLYVCMHVCMFVPYLHSHHRLAGLIKPDSTSSEYGMPELNVSYKPQKISPKFEVGNMACLHFLSYMTRCL